MDVCLDNRKFFFPPWTRSSPPFPDRLFCFSLTAMDAGGFSQGVDGVDHEVHH